MLRLLLPCFLVFSMLNVSAQKPTRITPEAKGNYSVIAFLVDFKEDKDSLTFGNGKFNLSPRDTGFVGSFPHDETYFTKHLEFLKNYWEGVSKGKMTLSCYLIPVVVTLPHNMEYYSTFKQSTDTVYSRFIKDFTAEAKLKIPNFEDQVASHYLSPEKTHFIVFHAGLGHDIDWSSIYSYDPTPRDISSLFLSPEFIGKNFSTIPNLTPNIKLNHLSILPETLTRPYEAFGTKSYLNYGISGLMVANFGNFLGLSDLYNTTKGNSVTGAFGLMDGYGFFNYNGYLPSPPSIWEKYQLGWVDPILLDYSSPSAKINIKSDVENLDFDSSAVFIYLGSNRYYLLENKLRENPANKKGVTVSYFDNQLSKTKQYSKDENGFYQYDLSDIKGVITGLTNYNWVVPAGITSANDTVQGGVLIWKLDDQVVIDKQKSNKLTELNGDSKKQALKLMEADGSFDIGNNYGSLSGASGSESGTIFDYWYQGNRAPLFKNLFSTGSIPSSDWEYLIPTNLKLSGFGKPSLRAVLNFEFQPDNIPFLLKKSVKTFQKKVTDVQFIKQGNFEYQIIFFTDSVYVYSNTLLGKYPYVGKDSHGFRNYAIDTKSDANKVSLVFENEFCRYQLLIFSNGQISDTKSVDFPIHEIGYGYLAADLQLIEGKKESTYEFVRLDYNLNVQNKMEYQILSSSDISVKESNGVVLAEKPDQILLSPYYSSGTDTSVKLITVNKSKKKISIYESLTSDPLEFGFDGSQVFTDNFGKKMIMFNGNEVSGYDFPKKEKYRIASVKNDSLNIFLEAGNETYIFTAIGNLVYGYESGVLLSSFPVEFLKNVEDLRLIETAKSGILLLVKTGGNWFSKSIYDNQKPVLLSITLSNNLNSNISNNEITASSVSNSNTVEFVELKGSGIWNSKFSSESFSSIKTGQISSTKKQFTSANSPEKELAYSWPNPASGDVVHFRLNMPFTGSGTVTVFDLTGQKIKTLQIQFAKNQEVEADWFLNKTQTGMYFSTVDVNGSGKSFSKIIKVVVTK